MKVSCIIPAYNEEQTIKSVLRTVKKVETIDEIIVVDDGSKDKTSSKARAEGVKVIKHNTNRGKGAAMKTGFKASSGDVILFLDADLQNINHKKIASIVQPILSGKSDFVKTSFTRKRGRVTELVAKPLFKILSPFIKFEQPLSGQFAIKRNLLKDIIIDKRWGADIQILLKLVKKGVRMTEVSIGELVHKKQPLEDLAVMSEHVMKTVLSELGLIAHKHKLIIFDFDKTMIRESSIEVIAKKFGFTKKLNSLRKKFYKGIIEDADITTGLAGFFRGKSLDEIESTCRSMRLEKNMRKVIDQLKNRQYSLAIISTAFFPIVSFFAKRLKIDNIICPRLVFDKNKVCTGRLATKRTHDCACCNTFICKYDAARDIMKRMRIKPDESIAVADGKNDACLFRACGMSLAFNPVEKIPGTKTINHMSEVLVYAE